MKSTFLVTFHTNLLCDADVYAAEVEQLKGMLSSLFTDASVINDITSHTVTHCHTEAELAHESSGLTAKCVLDFEAPQTVKLDKVKLTAAVRAKGRYKHMKVSKRFVSVPEVPE